jgi:hypothetical protein
VEFEVGDDPAVFRLMDGFQTGLSAQVAQDSDAIGSRTAGKRAIALPVLREAGNARFAFDEQEAPGIQQWICQQGFAAQGGKRIFIGKALKTFQKLFGLRVLCAVCGSKIRDRQTQRLLVESRQ